MWALLVRMRQAGVSSTELRQLAAGSSARLERLLTRRQKAIASCIRFSCSSYSSAAWPASASCWSFNRVIASRGLLFGVYVGEDPWSGPDAERVTRTWYIGMAVIAAV